MRNLRFLLLLGVGTMVAAVVFDYVDSRKADTDVRVDDLKAIPSELNSQASRWHWAQSSGDWRKVEILADSFRQSKETFLLDLEGVELHIFQESGKTYDLVLSPAAQFDSRTETLYSEGEVTLLLGLSADEGERRKERQPTTIRSSGVTFEVKTGICRTGRYTEYEFEGGSGHSQGALYDSVRRYFRMNADAYLRRDPTPDGRRAMEVQSAQLQYDENDQRIDLKGGVSMDRGSQSVQAAEANVYLEGGAIRRVEAREAVGVEEQPQRTIAFRGDSMTMWYGDGELLEKVSGSGSAELRSTTAASETRAWGERMVLIYASALNGEESELQEADVRERAGIDVRPSSQESAEGSLRRLESEWIHMTMREGGQEIEVVKTVAPGTLELIPGHPEGWNRRLAAKTIRAHYGERNRMEKLRAMGNVEVVSSRAQMGEENSADPLLTWSSHLEANFDSAGEATHIRQWENFRFEQGKRKGRSGAAKFDVSRNLIELRNSARVSDTSGNVAAHKIVMNDGEGIFEAEGEVSATHDNAEDTGGSAGLFSSTEPVFATAQRMFSDQAAGLLRYEGQSRLWQGTNRIEGDRVEIDRPAKTLSAQGNVVSIFRADEPEQGQAGGRDSGFVTVSADAMNYDDHRQRALYSGSARLVRDGLTVQSGEIEAFLEPEGEGGRIQLRLAYARGQVSITKEASETAEQRQGFGDEAEYRPADGEVVLTGAPARLRSASGDETRGAKIIYHIDDDRLLVAGGDKTRTYTYRAKKEQNR